MKFLSFLFSVFLFSLAVADENLIDNPELLYQASTESNNVLNQRVTINRTFNNIEALVNKLNTMDGVNAKIKNQSADKPIAVNVVLNNGTLSDLLNKTSQKLGYNWKLIDSVIIFSAINPIQQKQITKKAASQVILKPHLSTQIWVLDPKSKTLRNALTQWCKTANWQLIWNVRADYPITTSWTITGSFDTAINEVLKASQSTDMPLTAIMHDSNRVLEILSPSSSK